MTRWPRPARPVAPTLGAVAAIGIWWVVAHDSGAGWVQVVGELVFGLLTVGVVGPAAALARCRLEVVGGPLDAQAGRGAELRVRATRPVRVTPVEPPGPPRMIVGTAALRIDPEWRGVFPTVEVRVASAAPFGFQWWSRSLRLSLPAPLHVAPRMGRPGADALDGSGRPAHGRPAGPGSDGEHRSSRPYVAGDSRRRVHWPLTAHAGQLMVRETQPPPVEPLELTVALPLDRDQAEQAAGDALATVLAALDAGRPVLLRTWEGGTERVEWVEDRREAGRRLARAGAAGSPPRASA